MQRLENMLITVYRHVLHLVSVMCEELIALIACFIDTQLQSTVQSSRFCQRALVLSVRSVLLVLSALLPRGPDEQYHRFHFRRVGHHEVNRTELAIYTRSIVR